MTSRLSIALSLSILLSLTPSTQASDPVERDLVIYGGTSAGLVAAIQARAMGKTVIVIEPSQREGGLTTGGLGQTDIGNKMVIGGLSREFYHRVALHYAKPESWTRQKREDYKGRGQSSTDSGEATMWTFEPSVALKIYRDWCAESGIELIRGQRLDRTKGVLKENGRIVSITMESGEVYRAKVFLDTTYEGDLMAAAGVSYTVGREPNSQYGETLSGVQTQRARYHQFVPGVDPYVKAGDPQSGLLPFIDPKGPGEEGDGDKRVQAYCFRMCLTDDPENRIPFEKPEGYDEQWYELLLRNYEAGETIVPWINAPMPNRKTDTNNRLGFSTDFIGQNYQYPEATYAEREKIIARHLLYQQGLMWTLANHPRMPDTVRNEVARWGMSKDEFVEGQGWQDQLYIREARRMVSDFVMTELYCRGEKNAERSVGMGAYTMDSHHTQRYVGEDGFVHNEGDVQVGGFPPYPIDYGALVPKRSECKNLLVPICLSASHMAFGSIRMEPVFMVLGQSAATAASLAIDAGSPVQDIDYTALKTRLEADHQILEYTAPPRAKGNFVALETLSGIVVDDTAAQLTGNWKPSIIMGGIHRGYQHDEGTCDGKSSARFTAALPAAGEYEVQIAWIANPNRSTRTPVKIEHADGISEVTINQKEKPSIDKYFHSVGRYRFEKSGTVTISNLGVDGHVIIDAVRWIPVGK